MQVCRSRIAGASFSSPGELPLLSFGPVAVPDLSLCVCRGRSRLPYEMQGQKMTINVVTSKEQAKTDVLLPKVGQFFKKSQGGC